MTSGHGTAVPARLIPLLRIEGVPEGRGSNIGISLCLYTLFLDRGSKAKGLQVLINFGAYSLGRILAQLTSDGHFVIPFERQGQVAGLIGVFVEMASIEMVEYIGAFDPRTTANWNRAL